MAADFVQPGVGCSFAGNRAYVADNTRLRIVDMSNPANPQPMGTYDTGQ